MCVYGVVREGRFPPPPLQEACTGLHQHSSGWLLLARRLRYGMLQAVEASLSSSSASVVVYGDCGAFVDDIDEPTLVALGYMHSMELSTTHRRTMPCQDSQVDH